VPTPRVSIDDLPSKATPDTDDSLVIQDSGVTKKTTINGLMSLSSAALTAHLADATDAHAASAISAAPSGVDVDGANVQVQLGQLADQLAGTGSVSDVLWVGPSPPTNPDTELWWDTDAVASGGGGGGGSDETVDTGESYKTILYSDGRVRAVPVSAVPPAAPGAPTLTAKVASVRLNWTAVSGATYYGVYRDGVWIASVSETVYRDFAVTTGETYLYKLRSANAYDMVSESYSSEVSVFVDPALNVAPTVEVRTWPTSIPVNQRAIVRINAVDVDAQTLANTLSVNVGSLVGTADPSIWILIPA
jgi:hypothetical protein